MPTISEQNATMLTNVLLIIYLGYGLPREDKELRVELGAALFSNVKRYYAERGKAFNSKEELISTEALKWASNELNNQVLLTMLMATSGINPEEMGIKPFHS